MAQSSRPQEPEPALATSDTAALPDYTAAPGARIPAYAFTADATRAPMVGQAEEVRGEFAETPSALADKYLFSQLRKESMIFLIPLLPIIWIFLQDNGAGRLQTGHGVLWCLVKCGIALPLCAIPVAVAVIVGLFRRGP
ncbi:MAG: hypothetical protein ACLQVN_21400 [Bryobacteraceae bacterium]